MNNNLYTIDPIIFEKPTRIKPPYSWVGHIPFAFYLIKYHKPSTLVELGTHTGNSYFAFCQAVDYLGLFTKVFAVDTWEGDKHAGFYSEAVYEDVTQYNEANYSAFSTLLRKTFDEALTDFEDCSIDLLHIDGLHTYEAVKHDFESWLPKMSDRGIVLFHDTAVRKNDFGVWKLWGELKQTYPGFTFNHSNGLGVLMTGKKSRNTFSDLTQNEKGLFPLQKILTSFYSDFLYHVAQKELNQEQIKIYYKSPGDKGFSERKTISHEFFKDNYTQELVFTIDEQKETAKDFRLDPTEQPIAIKINTINLKFKDDSTKSIDPENLKSNAALQEGSFYIFVNPDPKIHFSVPMYQPLKEVALNIKILAYPDNIGRLLLKDKSLWGRLQSLYQSQYILDLQSQSEQLRRQLDAKNQEIASAQSLNETLRKQFYAKEQEVANLQSQKDKLYRSLTAVDNKNRVLSNSLSEIKNSLSYLLGFILTTPFRKLYDTFSKEKNRQLPK